MTDHQRPDPINNRPGLNQLSYRIGDYSQFRQRLLAALTTALQPPVGVPGEAPLAKLTTRDANDPAIALLDSWAVVADVLTFYQERIANEGFLRPATERRSVLELARAIGYELDPGIAASTYLSFKVEDAPGSPRVVPVPLRTQVMSVPAKDELPQIFETIEAFTARLDWNGLHPRASRPQRVYPYTRQLYLAGASTQLQPGDLLLLVDDVPDRQTYLLPLQAVTPNPPADYTLVQWRESLPSITTPLRRPQLFAFRLQAHLFGYNAPPWEIMPAEVKLAAIEKGGGAIQGGVFRSESDGLRWTAASKGLPDSDILCLAARNQVLFAGTPDKGVFRSTDNGQTWKAANEGITSMNVLALHISAKDSVFNEAIFAGTPNGGVFRSKDQGKNWVAINQGTVRSRQVTPLSDEENEEWEPVNTSLPNTVVRSLLTYENEGADLLGTFEVDDQTVTDPGGADLSNGSLSTNDIVRLTLGTFSQRRRVINEPTSNSFKIDEPFVNLPRGTSYSATVTITFMLDSEEQTDEHSISSGTISINGNEVVGEGTHFEELLDFQDEVSSREGVSNAEISEIIVESLGHTFSVAEESGNFRIESDTSLFVDTSNVQLFVVNSHILVGTDQGIYRAAIKADNDQGRSWYLRDGTDARAIFALEHISGDRIVAGTDDGILTSENNGASWNREWDSTQFESRMILSLSHYGDSPNEILFVGTAQGIYRYEISGDNWTDISGEEGDNSSSLAGRSVTALAAYERGGTRYLFAATDDGIVVSTNSDGDAEAVTWQRISQDLATQAATAVAVDNASQTLFAGTQFVSFLPTTTEAETEGSTTGSEPVGAAPEKLEWPNFTIQDPRQLDLDTLYPRILPNSWIILVDDRDPNDPEEQAEPRYAVRQVPSIAAVDRQDFRLSGKISRLELDVAVDPARFGLRSARLLGQSTEMPLAPEPLTVRDRQREIFADPIIDDTVYLQNFVQDLQPGQVVMVNGKHMRMQLSDVGGVLRSRYNWQSQNAGLNNFTINALIEVSGEKLLVATNEGLYSRENTSDSWKPVAPFRFKTIHSLALATDFLLIGAELELYRAKPVEATPAKVELPIEATILTLHNYEFPTGNSGTITSMSGITFKTDEAITSEALPIGTVITVTQTHTVTAETDPAINPENLPIGSEIPVTQQTRIITEDVDATNQTFQVNRIFAPALSTEDFVTFTVGGFVWLAGTDRGILRSTDEGKTWEYLKSLRDRQVNSLITRTNGSIVEIFAGTDQGLYYSTDSGQNWYLLSLVADKQTQPIVYSLAKQDSNPNILVGTVRGLYWLESDALPTDDSQPKWPQKLDGLRDRTILSLHFQGSNCYVGTDQGIYRFANGEDRWEALDEGLQPSTGRALLVRGGELLVGTERGLFALQNEQRADPVNWSRSNTGIINSQLLSLASSSDATTILAGTTAGLYRSTSAGRTWTPFDDDLDRANAPGKLRIQAVLNGGSKGWFVGTPEGVFVYAPLPKQLPEQPTVYRWQPVGRSTLPYLDVRAISQLNQWLLVGTVDGGLFKLNLDAFAPATETGAASKQRWQPTGLNNTSVQAIAISAVSQDVLYVGTAGDGVYRSSNGGNTWQRLADQRSGIGTLGSDGSQVTWNNSASPRFLQAGDVINANGQSRTVLAIQTQEQPTQLIVDTPFRPSLSAASFTIDTGLTNQNIADLKVGKEYQSLQIPDVQITYDSANSTLKLTVVRDETNRFPSQSVEKVASIASFLIPESFVRATQDQQFEERKIISTELAQTAQERVFSIQLKQPFLSEQTSNTSYEIIRVTLYAGTAGSGVFRSEDGGDRWQQIITNLDDLNIRCLLCEEANTVWVGTETAGVYRSINRGDLWSAASLNLTNTDVRSLLRPNDSTLLVGGIGILKSEDGLTVKPIQRHDQVHVIKPPQPSAPPLAPPPDSPDAPIHPLPQDYCWYLRDKDGFVGLLKTTTEQLFPLLPAAEDDALVSEQARIQFPPVDQQLPILTLQEPITYSYDPATVEIAANVVKATHGETVLEILGSGDGNTANQRFALKKPPLTYGTAANARGSESTLEVWVDDVLWEEASSLYSLAPHDQDYIVRIEDDDTTTVTFGDGDRGARPPSGQENITARYRSGIGRNGNVAANRLTILKTRPQGIAKVTNALPATGGTARESLSAARTNAPPTARTLGRIVSLQDFQDFAQGFVGIGKAQVVALWDGNTQVVHITIAGVDGAAVPETDALYQSLVGAIAQARDPMQQVQVDSYERLLFNLEAKVLLDPRYQEAIVKPQLMTLLSETFAFDRRGFGQPATSAAVIAALQSVPGVVAVDLDALYRVGRSRALNSILTAQTARYNPDAQTIEPAQLFLLSPVGIQLTFVPTL